MTRVLLLAAVAAALSCGGQLQSSQDDSLTAGSVRLRLLGGNLSTGNDQSYTTGEGLRIVTGLHPDVAMLQEFNYKTNQPADFQAFADAACGAPCYYYREAVAGGGTIPNAIISRYPIKSAGHWADSSVSNRGYAYAQIDIPGPHDLWVVSVHLLTSPSNHGTEGSQIVSDLKAIVPAGDYMAIAGDFNSTSRTDAAVTALSALFKTTGPYPVDQAGKDTTNEPRNHAYDWVLVSPPLDALQTPVVIGANSYPSGLVVDTRVYSPIADLAPALASDSGSLNMQHMAVVRDFAVAGDGTAPAGVAVLSPNGGESWTEGTAHPITWSSSGVANVKLELSADAGKTFSTLVASTPAAAGSWSWTTPSTAIASAIVRVSDASNAAVSDSSNSTFAIVASAPSGDAYEPDNTSAQAKAIAVGASQTHDLSPATDQDWVTFTLTKTTNVSIATSGPAGGSTTVTLFNGSVSTVGSATGSYATLKRGSLAAGKYYVRVTSGNGKAVLGYKLAVSSY